MQNRSGPIVFSELELAGKRIVCPHCLVPFIPHLGHMIATKFQCESCKAYLSYRDNNTVRCPCCHFTRPAPECLRTLVCEGCAVTIIYSKNVLTVNCPICKWVTRPPRPDVPVRVPDRVYRPQVYLTPPPQQVESTASSSLAPKPESSTEDELSGADLATRILRNALLGVNSKREKEEDKTGSEETESKKIRRL